MGPQSKPEIISSVLRSAESVGLESAWVVDHLAIPPDDAEGSGGRYLDPLTVLSWMAGQTKDIMLGTGVLILPYRPRLPLAKAIASLQELSSGRFILGVGVGWMDSEFRVLGVPRNKRGKIFEETLSFINDCFEKDVMSSNGQDFIFEPKPKKPSILVGGMSAAAFERAVKVGAGWFPIGQLSEMKDRINLFRDLIEKKYGRPSEVVTYCSFAGQSESDFFDELNSFRDAGISRVIINSKYETADDWSRLFEVFEKVLPKF